MNRKEKGKRGEEIAINYLIEKGYKIVEKNFNCPLGEIDIIAKRDKFICFIEVKYRENKVFGNPLEAVDNKKLHRIKKVLEYYCLKNKIAGCPLKIEVIGITEEDSSYRIDHIKNVIIE